MSFGDDTLDPDNFKQPQPSAREQAAEHALRAVELEREAAKHCTGLANPEYIRLMREAARELALAENYLDSKGEKA